MQDRGFLDSAEFEGVTREALAMVKRAANAAGYDTADKQVQAALLRMYPILAIPAALVELVAAAERVGDYVRDLARKRAGEW